MKKSEFTEQQIAFALHQAETGTAIGEACRKMGISEQTFCRWEKRYGGLMPFRAQTSETNGGRERAFALAGFGSEP
jgi:putative transposase